MRSSDGKFAEPRRIVAENIKVVRKAFEKRCCDRRDTSSSPKAELRPLPGRKGRSTRSFERYEARREKSETRNGPDCVCKSRKSRRTTRRDAGCSSSETLSDVAAISDGFAALESEMRFHETHRKSESISAARVLPTPAGCFVFRCCTTALVGRFNQTRRTKGT